MRIASVFKTNVQGVVITTTLDTRKPYEAYPVAVRVTYDRKSWYY